MAIVSPAREDVTAIVLCGGKGSRLDGQDKPLVELHGRRLIERICERLERQVKQIVISCSRNVAIYEAMGYALAVDKELNQGPLAGLTEAFPLVETEWAFTTPGDTPFIATDIVARMSADAVSNGVAVPSIRTIRQNLCLLLNSARREELIEFHARGGSAVKHWLDDVGVDATDLTGIERTFFNINTRADLEDAKQLANSDLMPPR